MVGACAACDWERDLVRHHWFERRGRREFIRSRWVCPSCNALLTRVYLERGGIICPVYPEYCGVDCNHLLPKWEKQVAFVRDYRALFIDEQSRVRGQEQEVPMLLELSVETMALVRKRVEKTGDTVSGYLAKILTLQVGRKR